MSAKPQPRRWLTLSVLLHASVIGGAIAWHGFGESPPERRIAVALAMDTQPAAALHVVRPIESLPVPAELHDDAPFAEPVDAEVPLPEFEEEVTPDELETLREDPPPVCDWMTVIRKPQRVDPAPQPTVAKTRVEPTPLVGQSPPPTYPRRALRLRRSGTVLLRVMVARSGEVVSCVVATSSGSRLLDTAALRAVTRWRFSHGPGSVLVPIDFRLTRGT